MGRPPSNGGPAFRFTQPEVAEMEGILHEHNNAMPARDVLTALAEKFSESPDRKGKITVQMKQVWNWFQNKRYAIRAKSSKTPGKLNITPMPRDHLAPVRNMPQPIAAPIPAPSTSVRMAPIHEVEFQAFSNAQKKGMQLPSGTSPQAIVSEDLTRKCKNDATSTAAKSGDLNKPPKLGDFTTPLAVDPLRTVYVSSSSSSPQQDDVQIINEPPSWAPILKSVEIEFVKMDGTNKKQRQELENLKKKMADSERRFAQIGTLEKEVGRLKKALDDEKTKQSDREKELIAEKNKVVSDLELEKGISKSLRVEVSKKDEKMAELMDELDGLKHEAADQHNAGFEKALDQVRFLHEGIDLSETGLFKVVHDGKLVYFEESTNSTSDAANNEVGEAMTIDKVMERDGGQLGKVTKFNVVVV